jgi:hypothetical protein
MTDVAKQEKLSPDQLQVFVRKVFEELNKARTNPRSFVSILNEHRKYLDKEGILKLPGRIPIKTHEGQAIFDDASKYLETVEPQPPFILSEAMCKAAQDMVNMNGPVGKLGHQGVDNSTVGKRIAKYGHWEKMVGESLDFGNTNPQMVVLCQLLDDGVPSRNHRKSVFNPELKYVGIGFGPHAKLTTMCVIDYAVEFTEENTKINGAVNHSPVPQEDQTSSSQEAWKATFNRPLTETEKEITRYSVPAASSASDNQAQIDIAQHESFLLMKPKPGKYETQVRVIQDTKENTLTFMCLSKIGNKWTQVNQKYVMPLECAKQSIEVNGQEIKVAFALPPNAAIITTK